MKFLILLLIVYLFYRIIRGFFKGIFIVTQIKRDQNESANENPFVYRSSPREKDISDKARILEEEKKIE